MTHPERYYEIYEVSELTGLAPARLRAWERRYAVVRPQRRPNRYRAYTARQVALLRAFARLIQAGGRIGDLVAQPVEQVLARAEAGDQDGTPVGALLAAMERLDRDRMRQILQSEFEARGLVRLCDEIIHPLGETIGDRWALGTLPISLEHLASETVVSFLKHALAAGPESDGPLLLAACLSGERHEWGVLRSLAHAQAGGWRLRYLGADLPLNEAIEAAWRSRPAMLALSASDAANVGAQLRELMQLPRRLPEGVVALVGGRGFAPFLDVLETAGLQRPGAEFPVPGRFTAPEPLVRL